MAGILGRLFRSQKKVEPDSKVMELDTAKEILAEVFGISLSDVDEMIQNRSKVARPEEISTEEDDLWPQEFRLEDEATLSL